MRIKVGKAADALYFRLGENKIYASEEVQPGVILDFDDSRQVVGFEIQNVSKRTSLKGLSSIQFE